METASRRVVVPWMTIMMHRVMTLSVLVLTLAPPAAGAGDRLIEVFDSEEIHWIEEQKLVTEPDGFVMRHALQTVERTIDLPPAPKNQRDAQRITAIVQVEPIYSTVDGRLRPNDLWTRLGNISIVVPADDGGPIKELELVRFITGYGAPGTFKQDVTALAPHLYGRQTIRGFISTYSDKPGWKLSVSLRYTDEGVGQRRPVFAERVFHHPHVTAEHPKLETRVEIPTGLDRPRLRIITTGHATQGTMAENEFISCTHILRIDGEEIARWRPWSEGGGPLRPLNPTAGWNRIDGRVLRSSDYDRTGWHPGLVVEPLMIPVPELTPGRHTIELTILDIKEKEPLSEDGKRHHGYWYVSMAVVADEPWPIPETPR
jgi:hypothetical protein